MDPKCNKDRSTNFSRQELNKLKDLLEKYCIILCKKTDHVSSKQKNEAWTKLTNEFNSTNAIYRTKKQLTYKYNNMKKTARQELSHEKKERKVTGGGPPPPKPSDTSEWLCSIMGESIVGMPSIYDSDFTKEHSGDTQINTGIDSVGDITIIELPIQDQHSIIDISENQDEFETETLKQRGKSPDSMTKENYDEFEASTSFSMASTSQYTKSVFVSQEQDPLDTSTPKTMLKKPVSMQLVTGKKRKNITPLETRNKIANMASEKEQYIKNKGTREEKLLEYAEEEHRKNMLHKEQLHEMEVEYKKKLYDLLLKKASYETQIQELHLLLLKNENKDMFKE